MLLPILPELSSEIAKTHMTAHTYCTDNCLHSHSLDRAQKIAQESGHRWSETRTQVYHALLMVNKPVTAYELLDIVADKYERSTKPASIYRSLDALMDLGVVAKIESANAYIVCQNPECTHQHIFLICDQCGHIDEIADHGISSQLMKDATERGFTAKRQILELHGECRTCQRGA